MSPFDIGIGMGMTGISSPRLKQFPALENASLALELNFGGPWTKSAVYADSSATTPAALGDAVLAFKDVSGAYTWSSASGRGPVLTACDMLTNKQFLYCHDLSLHAAFASVEGFSLNIGSGGSFAVVAVIITPRTNGLGSTSHQFMSGVTAASGPRQFNRRQTTGDPWASWQSSASWLNGATTLSPVEVYVCVWQYRNQKLTMWLDGVSDATDETYAHATLLNAVTFLQGGGVERYKGGLAWWGLINGPLTDPEIAELTDVLTSWFPKGRTGTHDITSRFSLADTAQGYTTDGTYHYATSTNILRKYTADGTQIDSATTFNIVGQDHTGDCCHYDGIIYLVNEQGVSGATNMTLAWHDAETLDPIDYIELTNGEEEASGCAVDPARNRIYVCSFGVSGTAEANNIYSYNLTTKEFVETISIGNIADIQGCSVRGDYIYFSQENGPISRMHLDHPGEREFMCSIADDYLGGGVVHNSGIEFMEANVAENAMVVQILDGGNPNHLVLDVNFNGPLMYLS